MKERDIDKICETAIKITLAIVIAVLAVHFDDARILAWWILILL